MSKMLFKNVYFFFMQKTAYELRLSLVGLEMCIRYRVGPVHLAGLLSPGGVHSHEEQIFAACEMAVKRGIKKLYVHGILDGRDVPPRSAEPSIKALQAKLDELGTGCIATLTGRYYAMDRDNRWERVEPAYVAMTEAKAANHADSGIAALEAAYARDEDDEFVAATVIGEGGKVEDGDSIIFMNFAQTAPVKSPALLLNLTSLVSSVMLFLD